MYDRRLAIESVTRVGPGQFVLGFECPEIAAQSRPGHFVMISVGDSIDPLLRRPMAIYRLLRGDDGVPRGFTLLIEVVGRGTALLERKRPGDELDVLGPLGTPFDLAAGAARGGEHLLVMGGVGSAPFPLLAEELRASDEPVRAFVGSRSAEFLLCVEDFEALDVPVAVATDDGSRGHHGFVVGPLEAYLDDADTAGATLYACGPTPMMRAVHDIAVERDLPLQVSFEAPMGCGIGVCLSCVLPVREPADGAATLARCCREGPVFDSRRMVWQ